MCLGNIYPKILMMKLSNLLNACNSIYTMNKFYSVYS